MSHGRIFGLGLHLPTPLPGHLTQWDNESVVTHTAARQLRVLTGFPDDVTAAAYHRSADAIDVEADILAFEVEWN